ncbi:ABC transporter permease [Sneathiella litorea]|uniref:ABC transporter permease subunit n=1 Tax=Sneathiella litorea TaxID=2606216 RepID=A0A6L8W8N7_9PROT|nr:iron ABC transporter permease [Sneathiella litorea]MZR30854.1 ABC transporter permease subunit [Sneathiella litorea]
MTAFVLLIALVLSIPVLVVLGYIFVPAQDIWAHLASTVLPLYLYNTLVMTLGVAALVLVIGVGTAWLVTMCEFPGRRIFSWALFLPLAMPAYIIAYTYTGMLDFAGPLQTALRETFGWSRADYWFPAIRSLGGVIVMLGLVLYPYVYLVSRTAFLEQSICALEVGRTLGRGPWRGFISIALPLARPAIVTGLALALMETLSDFGTVDYFAVDTFTTGIYRTWLGLGEPAAAAQLAAILMVFVFTLILIERFNRGKRKYHHTTGRYQKITRYSLSKNRQGLAMLACALPIIFGFLLPTGWLIKDSVSEMDVIFNAQFPRLVLNSVTVALIASSLSLFLAMILIYGLRRDSRGPSRMEQGALRIASMGYAVPGPVLAVGIMLPFGFIDNTVDHWMRAAFGISTGLILSGTMVALLFAYIVRFLAISLNTVEAGVDTVTPNMDRAARTLGITGLGKLVRVHIPIVSGSLMTAVLLVFVDVMKELPATLVLRPFGFDTLAIRAYEMASDERLADAAGPSLAIVIVGILPVVVLSRAIAKSRPGQNSQARNDY